MLIEDDELGEARRRRKILEPLMVVKGHLGGVTSACYSEKTDILYSGDTEGFLLLHQISTNNLIDKVKLKDGIVSIRLIEGILMVQIRNGSLILMEDSKSGVIIEEIQNIINDTTFCHFKSIKYQDCLYLATVSPTENSADYISLYDFHDRKVVISDIGVGEKTGAVMCIDLIQRFDSLYLLAAYDDGTLRSFELSVNEGTFSPSSLRLKVVPMTVTCMDYDPESDSIVVGGPDKQLILVKNLFSVDEQQLYRIEVGLEGFSNARFSPSTKTILTGGWDGKVRIFDAHSMTLLGIANSHCSSILGMTCQLLDVSLRDPRRPSQRHFSILLVGSKDGILSVWSLDSIESIASIV